ncbi:hypothetical protein SLS54_001990 [Diplodia seriata]
MLMKLICLTVSSIGLSMVSGFGGLLSFYIPDYSAAGADYADITALMTYPSMFMGIGNIVSVPVALAIGRRPVFMLSTLLLMFSAVLCAFAKDYTWHFSSRLVLGLAAGQSEALVPLMVQVRMKHVVRETQLTLFGRKSTSSTKEARC